MSRRSEGPHLWERPARYDRAGNLTHRAAWFIVDRTVQRSTGLGSDATSAEKEKALNAYLTKKHVATVSIGSRDPSQIALNDVLAKYLRDKERPYETKLRIGALRRFWGSKLLSEVTGDTCRAYASTRTTGAARRELEDFRSAINHHRREGLHDKIVSVVLPPKSAPRERWLTRQEAAQLIRAAWRYRELQNFRATDRHTRRHVAKFMLVASYMGSRASVICSASIETKRPKGRAWIDLTNGVYYGRAEGERQTNKRKQTERVPMALLAHLRRWRARGQRYVVEWNGEPVKRISKAHAAAVADAGLGPEVTPHTWRHCAATWLLQRGKQPWAVAGFLGVTVDVLLRVYGHHHPDHSTDLHKR
jgi:integrase